MSVQPPDASPWNWDAARDQTAPEPERAAPEPDHFRRTILLTVVGTLLPGLGLIAAGRRKLGAVVLAIFLTLIAAAVLVFGLIFRYLNPSFINRDSFIAPLVNPLWQRRIAVTLVVMAVAWVTVVVASHLSLRERPATTAQRAAGGLLVGLLAFGVAAPLAVGSTYALTSASAVNTIFKSEANSKSATRYTPSAEKDLTGRSQDDPWADKPRLNILLLGGDADKGRAGTRADTAIVASIDTKTGDTTLFSLPRNTGRMPFPAGSPLHRYYPNGFTNGDGNNAEFFLNAMYRNVPATVPKDVLGETDDLGADAMKISVGDALDLKIDYYMLINLRGFSKMINALGGIRLNVNRYIPIGGCTDCHRPPTEYLKPGKDRELDGRSALWYARGRYGSDDFQRMDRQRCVINAIIDQANPGTMLARYEDIAKAGSTIVFTDMQQEVLPAMVDLSLRVKNGNVRSIVFKNGVNGFSSPDPNFPLMRQQVKSALGEAKDGAKADPKPKKSSSGASSAPKPSKTAVSEDVDSTCAYDPKAVAAAVKPPGVYTLR